MKGVGSGSVLCQHVAYFSLTAILMFSKYPFCPRFPHLSHDLAMHLGILLASKGPSAFLDQDKARRRSIRTLSSSQ